MSAQRQGSCRHHARELGRPSPEAEDNPVDLPYLRAHPQHLPTFLTHQRIRETPVGGGVCNASRLTLDDGSSLFAKTWPSGPAPDGMFAAEAAGLAWLREAGAVPIPEV